MFHNDVYSISIVFMSFTIIEFYFIFVFFIRQEMNYLQNISEWEYSKLIDRMAQDDDVINARSLTYSMIIDQEFPSI